MIISTKKGTPKEELEKIVDKFENQGLDVTLITGKDYNVFGLVGDTTKVDMDLVASLDIVDSVKRVTEPFKCCNRKFHPDDTVVDVGGHKIGGGKWTVDSIDANFKEVWNRGELVSVEIAVTATEYY